MKLYQLTADFEQVRALLDDPDVDDQAVWDTLEGLQGEAEDKLLAIGRLIRERDAEQQAVKAEIDRLVNRHDRLMRQSDGLRTYAQLHMERMGLERVKDAAITLRLQHGPPAVEVMDLAVIPSTFKRATLRLAAHEVPEGYEDRAVYDVDKKAILAAHKDGASVQGTAVVQRKHLRLA